MESRLSIAVWISGGGTTLRNLLEKQQAGLLDLEIALVIASKPSATGLQYATAAGIPTLVVKKLSLIHI